MLRDGLHDLLKTAASGLRRDFLAQCVGIPRRGQVQCGVERMHTLLPGGAIADPFDLHLAKETLKLATVQAPLGAPYPVSTTDEGRPDIARSSGVQPALQELAEHLAASVLDALFSFTVCQPRSGGRQQLLDQVCKLHTGLVKRFLCGKSCGCMHPLGPPGEWPTVFLTTNLPQLDPFLKH